MSYIPDCRAKYEKDVDKPCKNKATCEENAINPYWYGLLQGEDKEFCAGYDWNTEMVLNNLFDNLEIYEEELEKVGIKVDDIDFDVVNGAYDEANITFSEKADEREVKWFPDYTDAELKKMNKATKIMLTLKFIVNHYIEMERDELVTSMIEDMSDEAHEEAMKKAKENLN